MSAQRVTLDEDLRSKTDVQGRVYTRRMGIVHAKIVVPSGLSATWAKDRSALWNAAEAAGSWRPGIRWRPLTSRWTATIAGTTNELLSSRA